MDVADSVNILKEYMKQLLGAPIDLAGTVLPLKKLDRRASGYRSEKIIVSLTITGFTTLFKKVL